MRDKRERRKKKTIFSFFLLLLLFFLCLSCCPDDLIWCLFVRVSSLRQWLIKKFCWLEGFLLNYIIIFLWFFYCYVEIFLEKNKNKIRKNFLQNARASHSLSLLFPPRDPQTPFATFYWAKNYFAVSFGNSYNHILVIFESIWWHNWWFQITSFWITRFSTIDRITREIHKTKASLRSSFSHFTLIRFLKL